MISVNDEMFKEIEDFRFEHRFQTRSEATAALIRLGLDALKAPQHDKEDTAKTD
jgi:metal-responsive CopG/Arc/MetJ family transcriptional regulator